MNRRGFIRGLVGGVAVTAAVRTWPFRVYSFPTTPVAVDVSVYLADMKIVYGALQQQVAVLPAVMSLFDNPLCGQPQGQPHPNQVKFIYAPRTLGIHLGSAR